MTIAGWGLNWPIIKVLLAEWPPLFARGAATLLAGVLLAGLALLVKERLWPGEALGRLAVASFPNVFAWMGLATFALTKLKVAECALLVYTMPLWLMLFEWPFRGKRPTGTKLLALALGFGGLVVLLGGQLNAAVVDANWAVGVFFALASAILFAAGTVLLPPIGDVPPLTATAWQVAIAGVPLVVLGLTLEDVQLGRLSPAGAASFAYMTLLPMGICYLTWFAALRRLPKSTASLGTLLVPITGIGSATLFLGEPLGPRDLVALAMVLGGVALALRTKDEPGPADNSA